MSESRSVQCVKTLLLSLSVLIYSWPLLSGAGHAIVVIAAILACIAASIANAHRVRIGWCLCISLIFIALGLVGSDLVLNVIGGSSLPATIQQSRFWYYTGLVFGVIFLTRSLALRYRIARIIEVCLMIGSVVYLFFAHRDFNLQNPRDFADMLYTKGYDPITVYRWMGIGIGFLALPLLLSKCRFGRTLYSMIVLALLALLSANLLSETRLPLNLEDPLGLLSDDNDDQNNSGKDKDNKENGNQDNADNNSNGGGSGDQNNDNNNNNGGGSGDQNNDNNNGNSNNNNNSNGNGGGNGDSDMPSPNPDPNPVAIAVFYDEYEPNDGVFHFRQNVLSEYDGNHLVASSFDTDVISTLPVNGEIVSTQVQEPSLHTKVSTSMFLIKEHTQPPQVGMGEKVFPIQNPDPKLFVSSYAVESVGLTIDLIRLIGRHSIPAEWSQETVNHYLEIPDDPRYQALSDIIVRKIDPRFYGDDVVKALYIKSWLEKNVYYTLKTKHIDDNDPTASFLFGSLRGYCVHIAHSAVYLLRSQGIAARVAIGYAVDNQLRDTGSAVLILGNQAHAWPEIYIDGVGWVTLEIFPENGDEPPAGFVDRSLESLFGELARNDKSGGLGDEAIDQAFEIPWDTLWKILLAILKIAVCLLYLRKTVIILQGFRATSQSRIHYASRASVFLWTMYGHDWRKHTTLENFAREEAGPDSATAKLIDLASAARFGGKLSEDQVENAIEFFRASCKEANKHTKGWRIILGWLNPIVRI